MRAGILVCRHACPHERWIQPTPLLLVWQRTLNTVALPCSQAYALVHAAMYCVDHSRMTMRIWMVCEMWSSVGNFPHLGQHIVQTCDLCSCTVRKLTCCGTIVMGHSVIIGCCLHYIKCGHDLALQRKRFLD